MASMSSSRVALVTGSNQGIGLEIVRQLSKKFDGVVLLAGMNYCRYRHNKAHTTLFEMCTSLKCEVNVVDS